MISSETYEKTSKSIKDHDTNNYFNPIQNGPFRGGSRMRGQKGPSSLKSVTHILQGRKLAQLYLT